MRIYVGNLPFRTNSEELRELFAEHGEVRDCVIPVDRDSGRSRGFGFVDMDDDEGRTAINALNGYDLDGRELRVNEARPRADGGGGGGYRGDRGGGYRDSRSRDGGYREPRYDDRGSRDNYGDRGRRW